MAKALLVSGILLSVVWRGQVSAGCPRDALAPLPFVIEYAVWRGWHQLLIYSPLQEPGCKFSTILLKKCLAVNGIASSTGLKSSSRVVSRLGILILTPIIHRNGSDSLTKLLKQRLHPYFYKTMSNAINLIMKHIYIIGIFYLNDFKMNTGAYDWLIATRSHDDLKYINEILNVTSIRFDQNIVAAYPDRNCNISVDISICKPNFVHRKPKHEYIDNRSNISKKNKSINMCQFGADCNKSEFEKKYYKKSERFSNLTKDRLYKRFDNNFDWLPLLKSGVLYYNFSRRFEMLNVSRFSLKRELVNHNLINRGSSMHVVQYFKVRNNSTLYVHYLGSWDLNSSMSKVHVPYPVEARNFLGETFCVGRFNLSKEDSSSSEVVPSSPALLDDVLHFLSARLNASVTSKHYANLGFRTFEGSWSGLLGAVMDGSVDLVLEPVTTHGLSNREMEIIFPIAVTMSNIYIRQQETSTVRDIFLAPFSARLLVCVLAVAVVASLAIVLISRAASFTPNSRSIGYAEALIWSTGILCQQGGTWTPSSPAASVLLIVCLLFAVVTYNAYAAFITSVLSVRVASIDTVSAVLNLPNYKIGYIRNGADQMYLMSTKDSQLNAIYIRGYSDADLVSSTAEGLARAATQDYAFFAGQKQARTTLRTFSQARGRCAVRELPVPSTRAYLAFPLPRQSPYAKPILLSLVLLRSGGALARLSAALVPELPQCAPPPGFASARASDVRSALILLAIGLIVSLALGIAEYSWEKRQQVFIYFAGCHKRLRNHF